MDNEPIESVPSGDHVKDVEWVSDGKPIHDLLCPLCTSVLITKNDCQSGHERVYRCTHNKFHYLMFGHRYFRKPCDNTDWMGCQFKKIKTIHENQ